MKMIIIILIILVTIYILELYFYKKDFFSTNKKVGRTDKSINVNVKCGNCGTSGNCNNNYPNVFTPYYGGWQGYYPWNWYNSWNYPYYNQYYY